MMDLLLGVGFNSDLIGPSLVLGTAAAGLYGLLAVSLVLTYRVSRTIGFVQGGIALFSTYMYWWLTYETGATTGLGLTDPRMGKLAGLIFVVLIGAAVGFAYGATVTGKRLANWPRLNLTIYSLSWLLLLTGVVVTRFNAPDQKVPSVFGTGTYEILDGVITAHQAATLLILVGLIGLLSFVMVRTQTGVNIRAIADDVEASRLVGVPLHSVGTGVYVFSGALSAFAGVLLASTVGTGVLTVLVIFIRALTFSVLGGFTSFTLALAGCLLLGLSESAMATGTFGTYSGGEREVVIMTVLFALVLVVNRLRPIKVLEAQGL